MRTLDIIALVGIIIYAILSIIYLIGLLKSIITTSNQNLEDDTKTDLDQVSQEVKAKNKSE